MKRNVRLGLLHYSVMLLVIFVLVQFHVAAWPAPLTDCNYVICFMHLHSFEFYVESILLIIVFIYLIDSFFKRKKKPISDLENARAPLIMLAGYIIYMDQLFSGNFESRYFTFKLTEPYPFWEYQTISLHFIGYLTLVLVGYAASQIWKLKYNRKVAH